VEDVSLPLILFSVFGDYLLGIISGLLSGYTITVLLSF